ncbi:MAG: signal peptide peptidase SppA [Alphaproteobacteria bacterium GM202ARS2]|nr:signal peptide peptidase SppA [Alphaproteobacteria bacterium GM202ARS2]
MTTTRPPLPQALMDKMRGIEKTTRWRALAVMAVLVAIALHGFLRQDIVLGPVIARLTVEGFIENDQQRLQSLYALQEEPGNVQALIVYINSPGGTIVGGEALYKAIRTIDKSMPVVAVMGEVATSAAYMTALAARHVLAHEGTITGSIGTILQTFNVIPLLKNLGILPETFKSGPLKASPSPFETTTEPVRVATRQMIAESQTLFLQLVQARRSLETGVIETMRDGRVILGKEAARNQLVDALGGEKEARQWLADNHNISQHTPIIDIDYKDEPALGSLLVTAALQFLTQLTQGHTGVSNVHPPTMLSSQQQGLLSLWLAP